MTYQNKAKELALTLADRFLADPNAMVCEKPYDGVQSPGPEGWWQVHFPDCSAASGMEGTAEYDQPLPLSERSAAELARNDAREAELIAARRQQSLEDLCHPHIVVTEAIPGGPLPMDMMHYIGPFRDASAANAWRTVLGDRPSRVIPLETPDEITARLSALARFVGVRAV